MYADRAREWLKSYQGLKFEYDTWADKLEMRENAQYLPAIPDSDGSKHTPGRSDRMANATVRRMEFEDETAEEIAEIKAKMKAIENAIKALPDPMLRGVLIQRYIVGFDGYNLRPWKPVAMQLFRKDDDAALKRVQNLHREALECLEEITDEENNLLL